MLVLSSVEPLRQFGIVVAVTILYSLFAAVLVQPACLKLWAQWRRNTGDAGPVRQHERGDTDRARPR